MRKGTFPGSSNKTWFPVWPIRVLWSVILWKPWKHCWKFTLKSSITLLFYWVCCRLHYGIHRWHFSLNYLKLQKHLLFPTRRGFWKQKFFCQPFLGETKNETFKDMVETLDSIGVVVSSCSSHHYCKKPELGFYAISNHACDVSEVCNVENIWKWSRIEIIFKVFSSFNLCDILMHKMVQSKCLFKYSRNMFITREPE